MLKKTVLTIFIVSVLTIGSLELLSRVSRCSKLGCPDPCPRIEYFMPPIPYVAPELADLIARRTAGEKILKKEYLAAADKFILEKSPAEMPCYNGIACGDSLGYVRNDLPKEAKKYVKRHELEHLLINSSEFSTNLAASKEYPLGLIQTIFFTLKDRYHDYGSLPCYISGMYKTFKTYFLP